VNRPTEVQGEVTKQRKRGASRGGECVQVQEKTSFEPSWPQPASGAAQRTWRKKDGGRNKDIPSKVAWRKIGRGGENGKEEELKDSSAFYSRRGGTKDRYIEGEDLQGAGSGKPWTGEAKTQTIRLPLQMAARVPPFQKYTEKGE